MTEHYLDQSSTTKPSDASVEAAQRVNRELWGNPSSVHTEGRRAALALAEARADVGRTLGMPRFSKDMLIFTSCGTEANNLAMLGCARSKKRRPECPGTVVISAGEHPSVENPAVLLEKEGYAVVRVPTRGGRLDLGALEEALESASAPVIFAAFMLVNNETGAVYDVKAAASLVRAHAPDAVIHCDAVQAYMKMKFTPMSLGVDTMTVSAHKIHSVRGAGALYVSADVLKRRNLTAVMPGGGQENGFRSGTENLSAIAGFAAAAREGAEELDARIAKTAALRAKLDELLAPLCEKGVRIALPEGAYLSNIASVVLPSIRSETMLNYLSGRGISVSAGSACSAASKKKSAALLAFGHDERTADFVIRVSIDHTNTEDDLVAFAKALSDGVDGLQRKR